MIEQIETNRLLMRQFKNKDFEPLAKMMADETHMQFLGGACDRQTAWRKLATLIGHWALRGFGFFALEEKSSGRFVGWTGLWFPEGWPEPEIGWTLVPEATGKGFATEAALRARTHAYEDLGWKTAISLIATDNLASQKVAERLGAVCEKTIEWWGLETGIYRHVPARHLNDI